MGDILPMIAFPEGYQVSMLALCAWREARGEGIEGMRAVMHVVRNRVKAWHKDYDEVIAGKNQFSSFTIVGDSQLIEWPRSASPKFMQVFQLATYIFDGIDKDPTGGALYYANVKNVTSGWFKDNIIAKTEEHPVKVQINNHTFYA